jgi:hypothetical protein
MYSVDTRHQTGRIRQYPSRARRARGITIEDAERDTHVSKRYLHALKTRTSAFPAPVYARGFRVPTPGTGLNPEELIRVFPIRSSRSTSAAAEHQPPVGNTINMN